MTYHLDNNADMTGTHLVCVLSGVNSEQVRRVFGEHSPASYDDYEAGYDGQEWHFVSPNGLFNLYSRYGNLRVGAWDDEDVADFLAWLGGKLGVDLLRSV